MKLLKRWLTAVIVLSVSAVGAVQFVPTTQAASPSCNGPFPGGRQCFYGFYYNVQWNGGPTGLLHDVVSGGVPAWVNNTPALKAWVAALQGGDRQQRTAARYIMSTMMGLSPNATPNYGDWTSLIDNFAGTINYSYAAPFPCGIVNTGYQSPADAPIPGDGDVTAWNEQSDCGGTRESIQFRSNNGSEYLIKRSCANPIGSMGPLEQIPKTFQNSVSVTANKTVIRPGEQVTLTVGVTKTGSGATPPVNVTGSTTESAGGGRFSAVGPLTPATSYGGSAYHWDGQPMPPTNSLGPYSYIVVASNTAPDGQYCFNASVSPANELGGQDTKAACVTVQTVYQPTLIGNNGDVHAGALACSGLLGGSGSISGNGASYSQYVVSTSGTINNYGSNNNASDKSASMNSYSQICRPNLVKTAQTYIANGGAHVTFGGGSVSATALAGLSPATKFVVYTPGDITITGGSLSKNITLYAGGTVTIAGNVTLTGTAAASAQPGLGIIAAGNINVLQAATRVDAFLFANGTINTCSDSTLCFSSLVVNGFLMANQLSFDRLGNKVPGGGPVAAETVNLLPQLYLNPPLLFSGEGNNSILYNLGERPPLY